MVYFLSFADQSNRDCTKYYVQSWLHSSISSSRDYPLWQEVVWLYDYYRVWQIKEGIVYFDNIFTA